MILFDCLVNGFCGVKHLVRDQKEIKGCVLLGWFADPGNLGRLFFSLAARRAALRPKHRTVQTFLLSAEKLSSSEELLSEEELEQWSCLSQVFQRGPFKGGKVEDWEDWLASPHV